MDGASRTLSIPGSTIGLAGVERRTKEHFHLSAGRAVSVKLLKTRGNWMKAVVGERRKMAEGMEKAVE